MLETQEPKYDCGEDGRLFNRDTGVTIPDNEPVFVLRAKDQHALNALRYYMSICCDENHQKVIEARIQDFKEFRSENPDCMKEPDSPPVQTRGGGGGVNPR